MSPRVESGGFSKNSIYHRGFVIVRQEVTRNHMRPLIKNLDPSTACPFLSPGRGPLWRKKHAMWLAVEEQGDDDDSLGGGFLSVSGDGK